MIFAVGLLRGQTSGVVGAIEETVEVLAPILETPSIGVEVEVQIPTPEAVSSGNEKEPPLLTIRVAVIEEEIEPVPVPILEAIATESVRKPLDLILEDTVAELVMEPLASVSEVMVTDREMELLTPILGAKSISEPSTSAPESVFPKADILAPIPESIPSKAAILVQESLVSLVTEPTPIISEETSVPIVEKSLPQEKMTPEIEATPTATEPNVPIIEESLPQESIAPRTKRTLLCES